MPEPEALDVKICSRSVTDFIRETFFFLFFLKYLYITRLFVLQYRNNYQIAVAGRGMQMIQFCPWNGIASVQ